MSERPKKCLIVDDSRSTRVLICNWMIRSNYVCSIAEDGNVAKSQIESNCPDVLITDIEMPFFNGLELVCWVRQNINKRISLLPIVVMTSLDDPELERIICEVGTSFVLRKPLSEDKFLQTVQGSLASSGKCNLHLQKGMTKYELFGHPSFLRRMADRALRQDFTNHDD
jgi:DNA-binding response OmpR family regulator